ncbi:MAG: polysaccharide biosynthesis/export family protein [Gammaproteobacteria bacterium]
MPPEFSQADNTYVIGVDDKVSVSVWRNADLSLTVPVRPDGRISTPLVGDVVAAGKTPMQLAQDIEVALSEFIREPNVSVIIVGLASYEYLSRVRITGAVRSPVSLPYRKGMTVLDLVLAAGGPNDFASPNRTVLYRTNKKGEPKRIDIKLNHLLKKGDIKANILLKPGDIVTVPESLF